MLSYLGGDFRIAARDCSLAIMEAKWGLIPDMGGTPGLRAAIGADHAMQLAMTAEPIAAELALSIGLITHIADDPIQMARNLAEQLKERSPDTNRIIKRLYQKIWSGNERKILAAETINQLKVFMGKNRAIAVKRSLGERDKQYRW